MVVRMVRILTIALLALTACVEIFEFNTSSEDRAVIIEGVFTDVSAQEYLNDFDEFRWFKVELNWASTVSNIRDEPISGAEIELASDANEFWDYTEGEPGVYQLFYPDLKAMPGVQYRLIVRLPDGNVIESALEQLPEESQEGTISFKEKDEPQYVVEAEETVIKAVDGVEVNIEMPHTNPNATSYYRWDFYTTWLLKAARIPASSPVGICWVSEQYYLDEYRLLEVSQDQSVSDLFFLPIEGNLQVENGFSVRVRQLSISTDYFQFWKDLENQQRQSELFAPPPYNLPTNLTITDEDIDVYGYFGVGKETNYTWYMNLRDLSYVPKFSAQCFLPYALDRPAYCSNCLNYESIKFGDKITNIQPNWWRP
ncbi:MAG: DUF4249 domain-containing protein [Reichenbachiella sp.]|uniref:DUF4249 domain-containing protein n=1 Tax=Reichenbachiella sp. TaxID=2184521 RepID=UPI003263A0EF